MDNNAQAKDALCQGIYGFEVITASHGIDALIQFKAHGGDFGSNVTDNDMPQMNDLEFVRSVRELGFKGRIVVMSGHLKVETFEANQEPAISGFFHKPFGVGLLATMLLQAD